MSLRLSLAGGLAAAFLATFASCPAQLAPRGLAARTVPELFAGEMDDVGPQYLLEAKPAPRHFEAWTDWEYSGTDNVMLESTNPVSSTLLSAQAGVTWRSSARPMAKGALTVEAGARAQAYRYGFLANSNHPVNFIEIDRNNFDLGGAHVAVDWRRSNWLVIGGVRAAGLRSRSTHRRFYEEMVTDLQVLRQWNPRPATALAAGIDASRRWTRTDSFGLLPSSWNDRAEFGLILSAEQRLGTAWKLQPSARLQITHYTHADRPRQDRHLFFRLSLARPITESAEVRLSIGQEQRESTDPLVPDYHKWDLALGGTVRWRF